MPHVLEVLHSKDELALKHLQQAVQAEAYHNTNTVSSAAQALPAISMLLHAGDAAGAAAAAAAAVASAA
jgi:hypothetical protein